MKQNNPPTPDFRPKSARERVDTFIGGKKRGGTHGWLPETIDKWNANRPGKGARTDLTRNQ